MIHMLRHISVNNFRNFTGKFDVPLDADVVLLFGPNGAGKSNLLAAIEFAITGAVRDLSGFGPDYPRCLRNLKATSDAEVSVSLSLADQGSPILRQLTEENDIAGPPQREPLRSFRERCYLSQRQLASFCERLSAVDAETGKPAIVSSLRSILGLELVERLQNALFDVEDRRRLRKVSSAVRNLDGALERLEQASTANASRSAELEERLRTLYSQLNERLSILGEPPMVGTESSDWQSVLKRFAPAQNVAIHGRRQGSDAQIRDYERRIADISTRLGRNQAQQTEIAALRSRLGVVEATVSRMAGELEQFASRARRELDLVDESQPTSEQVDIVSFVRYWTERLPSVIQEGESRLIQAEARDKRIAELTLSIVSDERSIAQRRAARQQVPQVVRELIDALAEVSKHVSGNVCPVCDRDFGEIKSAPLLEHIQSKIVTLQTGFARERDDETAFLELRARLEADRELLNALTRQVSTEQPIERLRSSLNGLRDLMKSTDALASSRYALESARIELDDLRQRLVAFADSERELERLHDEVRRIAADSNVPLRNDNLRESVDILRATLASRMNFLTQDAVASAERGREAVEITLFVENALSICRELDVVRKKAAELEKRRATLDDVAGRVGHAISVARDIAKTARRVEKDVLQEIFDKRLNVFIADLFGRLVPDEPFRPALSDPAITRGKELVTGMAARMGEDDVFDHLAAVLNAGNLNTAALVIFLSLHLIEIDGPQLLVLDDPIQNIDDVHVTQLAALLRELVRTGERQMVIAVHERALFDYLQLELGPTRDGDTMLAIELGRDRPITFERKEFSPGRIAFGH